MKSPICAAKRSPAKEICGAIDGRSRENPAVCLSRFRWQHTTGGVLIYDTAADALFEANNTGLEILRLLAENFSCQQIAAHLARRYGKSAEAILADVKEFVGALAQQGFMERP